MRLRTFNTPTPSQPRALPPCRGNLLNDVFIFSNLLTPMVGMLFKNKMVEFKVVVAATPENVSSTSIKHLFWRKISLSNLRQQHIFWKLWLTLYQHIIDVFYANYRDSMFDMFMASNCAFLIINSLLYLIATIFNLFGTGVYL